MVIKGYKSVGMVQQIQNFVNQYGGSFNQFHLTGGWNRNSYDQMPFPTSGVNQQAGGLVALPLTSDSLTYYKTSYQARMYIPLVKEWVFSLYGNVAYGNAFNGQGLPFFENYLAGGIAQPGQVRGYESFSLGPQDSTNRAIGANFLLNGSAELFLPYPFSRETIRTSVFADAGNVFVSGTPQALSGINSGPLRYSAGLAFQWRSPFGPLAFSLAKPLNLQPTDSAQYFQFSMSSSF